MPDGALVLVLRFRDLIVPEPGHTVAEHNKVTDAHGYTWWGWWRKPSEEIPVSTWNKIARQAKEGAPDGIRAFLLDSGQRKLYSTRILDVHFRPGYDRCISPEPTKTPAYYSPLDNPTERATWFKIGKITEEASEGELHKLMYAEAPHDDLVLVSKSDFQNRKMGGISHLLNFGNVTYWVGTPAAPHSKSALEGAEARILEPISPREIVRAENCRILHISDLHFGSRYHHFPLRGDAHAPSLANAVHDALERGKTPGLVIVSGDLTWSGAEEEFSAAYECLEALRSTFGLQKQHFIIIPGNHDLQWSSAQALATDYVFGHKVDIASEAAKANYAKFFEKWYGIPPNEFLSIGRRYFLVGGPSVDILGLNSTALQQIEGHFAGIGRVTERAFDDSAQRFGWAEAVRATQLRLLVVHHHLVPVIANERVEDTPRGFGVALDAGGQISRSLKYGVNLVIHGHQHHPFAGYVSQEDLLTAPSPTTGGVLVVGGGSAGVADGHLGPIRQRTFNMLHLDHNRIQLELYATSSARDQFQQISTGVVSATLKGNWTRA